jgi:DNA-binding CsgD family transcriptional regulator
MQDEERTQEMEDQWQAAAAWFTHETGIPVRGCTLQHSDDIRKPKHLFPLYDPYVDYVDIDEETNELYHYGTPRHSGRYPWGSGDNPYQRYANFKGNVDRLRDKGLSNTEIAKSMGMSTTKFRAKLSMATDELRKEKVAEVRRLKEKGYSASAIARRMGLPNESSVRSLLEPKSSARAEQTQKVIDMLAQAVKDNKYVDVGGGVENTISNSAMKISNQKLKNAVALMEEQGYKVSTIYQNQQSGAQRRTNIKVLTKEDTPYGEIMKNRDKIAIPGYYSEDHGKTLEKIEPPKAIDGKRVYIRYGDEGGKDRDGTLELRRDIPDISLNKALYAQVRVSVSPDGKEGEGTHYMKGMAYYSKDIPDGYDIVYNTKKPRGTEAFGKSSDSSVFKPIKDDADPDNPYGATIKKDDELILAQRHYIDKDGNRQLSCLNIVNEEGNWNEWTKTLSSQFLSKQKPALAKAQLREAYELRKDEFDEINMLTNPVVKKKLMDEFAEDCDAAASHLKGASLPRQRSQVILPAPWLKENEIVALNYENGERLVGVRYPFAGTFEAAEFVVNNNDKRSREILQGKTEDGQSRNAMDAVMIHPKMAAKMSGADFDGDTIICLPNNDRRIVTRPALEGLRDFDTDFYQLPADSPPVDAKHGFRKQFQMGSVSNLITDMTLKGATDDELERAVKHSMVIIDAQKHHLDWQQSEKDNDIPGLKTKYQGGPKAGAATLISQASSEKDPLARRLITNPKRMTPEQRERFYNGEKIYENTGRTYTDKHGKEKPSTVKSTKMAEAADAFELSSGTVMETIYATHANKLKALANEARKASLFVDDFKYDPAAKRAYAAEVDSLDKKLYIAESNRPLERKANLLASKWVQAIKEAAKESGEELDASEIKKIRGRKLIEARNRLGASKTLVNIEPKEWEAIQARAISKEKLTRILNNADVDKVRQYAMPRNQSVMSNAKIARARAMMNQNRTNSEIAEALGVSESTLFKALYKERKEE